MIRYELETVAREGKPKKTKFTPRQLGIMRAHFQTDKYLVNSEYKMLSQETNLTETVLRV